MTAHDARLVPAAIAAWLVSAVVWSGWPLYVMAIAAVGLVAGLLVPRGRPAMVLAVCAAAAAALCATSAVGAAAPVANAVGHSVTLVGTATSDSAEGVDGPTQGMWRVEVFVTSIADRGAEVPTRAHVLVWGGDDWKGIARGQRLVVTAKLAQSGGDATAMAWRPTVDHAEPPRGVDAAIARLRTDFRGATAALSARLGPLTRGMVIGDDSGMSVVQRAQMSSAGLTHLTAVSGSHFAVALVVVGALLRAIVRRRKVVAIVTAVVMGGLVLLVFPEPSVVRAATMAGAMCVALWWGRPAQALPALCTGVIAIAVASPRIASQPGFAMSVCAVAAIVLWAPALGVRLQRTLPPILAAPLAVCIAAQCAAMPVLVAIGATVGPWAVVANLAVGWCAAPVMVCGLSAVVIGPVWPAVATVFATVASWCAWPVDAAAQAVTTAPGANAMLPHGMVGVLVAMALLATAVALTFAVRHKLGLVLIAFAAVVVAVAVPIAPRLLTPAAPGDWLIVACDVGQGDGMLLKSGNGSAVAIDVGPEDGGMGECLKRYGVKRIDLLVITHPHADHEGALPSLVSAVPIGAAWISPAEHEQPTAATRALVAAGVPIHVAHARESVTAGDVTLTVLLPDSDAVGGGDSGLNNASIVTLASVGGVTMLGLGDLEHEGQRDLARGLSPMVVDVVKIPHHGSDKQEQALAERVTARVGVVSVGAHNTYGHPAASAITMWAARVSELVRTDQCGDVVIVVGPALASQCHQGVAGYAHGS